MCNSSRALSCTARKFETPRWHQTGSCLGSVQQQQWNWDICDQTPSFYGYLKNATSFPFWIHNCPYLCAWAVCEYFSKNQEMVIWGKMAFFLQTVERKYAKSFANALRPFWNWGIFTNIIKMCHQGGYLRKPITWNPSSIKYAKIVVGLALEERHMKRSPYIIPCTFNHVLLWKYLEDHF